MATGGTPIVVAVPIKDEEERIARCLRALSSQRDVPPYQILLLLNNCTDETAAIVGEIARTAPVPVHTVEVSLPPELANAGHARHLALKRRPNLSHLMEFF
jgi:cellulose synthase/poly-beta-1,6-N-acetylglucosamine synthase-like glycosyltransferase